MSLEYTRKVPSNQEGGSENTLSFGTVTVTERGDGGQKRQVNVRGDSLIYTPAIRLH